MTYTPIGYMICLMVQMVFTAIFALCLISEGRAHPVTYKGGWAYWGQFSTNSNIQRINYTFHPRFSIEANTEFYYKLQNYRDGKLGLNILVKRWIFDDSQANIYGALHVGHYDQEDTAGPTTRSQLAMDWESRKLYTALNTSFFYFAKENIAKLSYRAGFAPYVAGMEALQTWMVFQFDYFKEIEDKVKMTSMMRFFYNNALWEMGADNKGGFFLTLMVHY